MRGLKWLATNAPMYRAARTRARPPQTVRLPRSVPLSRLKGATPTRAAISRRSNVPSSGRWARTGEGETFPDSGNTAQQVILLSPYGTLTESLTQALVQIVQLLLEPCNVSLDAGTDGDGGDAKTVLLRDQHGHHLVPAGSQGVERLGLGVPQRARGRSDCFGEVGYDRRVKRVGLGQLPGGPGKVPHLAGVDDDHWQLLGRQSCYKGQFQAARSLQQHHNRFKGLQPGDQLSDPCIVIGNLPSVVRGADGDIHLGLGYINAYVDSFLIHEHLLRITGPSLQDAGLAGPDNCSGSNSERVRRPSLSDGLT